jgi:Cu/Ag efflux protein CusF
VNGAKSEQVEPLFGRICIPTINRKELAVNRRSLMAAAVALGLAATPIAAGAQTDEFVPGLVTKVDEPAQKITIKHGPLKKFDMEDGMTMVFRAADPAMLKVVKAGDRVRFVPERINGQFTVTKIEKVK